METLAMSRAERRRLEVVSLVKSGKLRLSKAGDLLGVSYRQMKRIWRRYQEEGDGGLVHRSRGRRSNRQSVGSLRKRALKRYAESLADYGPTLAAESLAEEGLAIAVSTLRRWLLQEGLWKAERRRKRHRRRRARRSHAGELVQMDGSHHDWFEGRRGEAVLMVMIDDATGCIEARFFEEETQAAAFEMMRRYGERHGLPAALYVDRAGIYRSDREATSAEIIAGREPKTQFGRALETLGVDLILARSAQAKGRVERMNRTLQDRLVKALRAEGLKSLAAANKFLEERFLGRFNKRFGRPPAEATDVHRVVGADVDLWRELAVHEDRVVQNDWTVRWHNRYLQLGRESGVEPGDHITVCEQLDNRLRLFAGDRELLYGTTRTDASPGRRSRSLGTPMKSKQGQKPSPDHPWRGRGGSVS